MAPTVLREALWCVMGERLQAVLSVPACIPPGLCSRADGGQLQPGQAACRKNIAGKTQLPAHARSTALPSDVNSLSRWGTQN